MDFNLTGESFYIHTCMTRNTLLDHGEVSLSLHRKHILNFFPATMQHHLHQLIHIAGVIWYFKIKSNKMKHSAFFYLIEMRSSKEIEGFFPPYPAERLPYLCPWQNSEFTFPSLELGPLSWLHDILGFMTSCFLDYKSTEKRAHWCFLWLLEECPQLACFQGTKFH